MQNKLRDIENAVCAVLRKNRQKFGTPGHKLFAVRAREVADGNERCPASFSPC